jgi:O-antigen ligase
MERIERIIFYLLMLLLPTQLGKHFWPDFTIVSGIRIDYLSPTVYSTDVLLILLSGCVLFRFCISFPRLKILDLRSKARNINKKKFVAAGFILLFLIVNCIFSSRPLLSFYGLVKFGEFVFLGFNVARTIKKQSQLQKIVLLFAISSIFESLLAIAQYVHQGSLNGLFYFFGERTFTGMTPGIANASINGVLVLRPYGTFSHPNVLAGYLLIVMVLVWSFLLTKKQLSVRIFAFLSLLINSVALLLTFSRVAILLWGVLIIIVLVRTFLQKLKTYRAKLTASVLILCGMTLLSFFPLMHELFSRFAQTSLIDESVTERTELLKTAFMMIRQHPVFGVGLYNFIPAMAPLQKPLPLGLYLQPVHNIFVLVAAEIGFIGLGLFVWLLGVSVMRIRKQESGIKGTLYVLLFIILTTGMFDHYWLTLQQGQLLFATVLGLSWVQKR